MQVSALKMDVQRLSQGKRNAEARAAAAETAAQQCQQELAAFRVLTATMWAHPQPPPQPHLNPQVAGATPQGQGSEGVDSGKPAWTAGEGSNSVVEGLTQQQGSNKVSNVCRQPL